MIPSGFRVERLRLGKGGEFIRKEFHDCCLPQKKVLEYASTNGRQQIGISERAGITLAAVMRCICLTTVDCESFRGAK